MAEVDYLDTAEASPGLPNVHGTLYFCRPCGVAYPSHTYAIESFPLLYGKAFADLKTFDEGPLQRIRKAYLRRILKGRHVAVSLSRLLDALSLHVLQVPRLSREARALRVLDVGSGFGEFLSIYQSLGNEVVGTEIIPELADRLNRRGLPCRVGELEELDFGDLRFDVILLRAVLYRTRVPAATLERVKALLAPGGEVALVDPCPGIDGVRYFFEKQFPQGQFYILDPERYAALLRERFGLVVEDAVLVYGRPNAPLKPIGLAGNLRGLLELLAANLFRYKPYVLSYRLRVAP